MRVIFITGLVIGIFLWGFDIVIRLQGAVLHQHEIYGIYYSYRDIDDIFWGKAEYMQMENKTVVYSQAFTLDDLKTAYGVVAGYMVADPDTIDVDELWSEIDIKVAYIPKKEQDKIRRALRDSLDGPINFWKPINFRFWN